MAEYNQTPPEQRQPLPPIGPSGPDLTGLSALLHPAGLGITGPGAHDAMRALAIATLSSGSPTDPDAQGILVTTTAIATSLFTAAPQTTPTPPASTTAGNTATTGDVIRPAVTPPPAETHAIPGIDAGTAADIRYPRFRIHAPPRLSS